MPVARNTRRSRRLSNRPPADPEFLTFNGEEGRGSIFAGKVVDAASTQTPELTCTTATSSPSISTPEFSTPSSPHSDDSDFALPFTSTSSHGRRKKEGHIPRPSNAFIIFRSEMWKYDFGDGPEKDHRQISRIAGMRWKALDEETKEGYKRKAREAKAEHARMYPGYRYTPTGKRKVKRRKSKQDAERERARASLISRLISKGFKQARLSQAVYAIEREGADERDVVAGLFDYQARAARTCKMLARPAHQQPVASTRTRQQPQRAPTRIPSITVSSPSALGLEFSGCPKTFQPELAMPQLVQSCSTISEAGAQSAEDEPYILWAQPSYTETLQAEGTNTLGMPFGAAQIDYDSRFDGSVFTGCAPGPVVSPLPQFSPLGSISSPLHLQSSLLYQFSPSPSHFPSPSLPSWQFSSSCDLVEKLSPFQIKAQPSSPLCAPCSQPSPQLRVHSSIRLPEGASPLSSSGSFGSSGTMYGALSYPQPATSPEGFGLLAKSYNSDSFTYASYGLEPRFEEWFENFERVDPGHIS